MRTLRGLVSSLAKSGLLALVGCAGVPIAAPVPVQLFHDTLFEAPTEPVSTADVFALDDAMRRYLAVDIAYQLRTRGLQEGLVEALSRRQQLKLEYDTTRTKNAAETFATRSGNCLSLVIMTAALAKELRLPIYYGSAVLDNACSRSGDLLFASGHVNLTISRRLFDARTSRDRSPMTIDFLPAEDVRGLQRREIAEATVIAMYANNRAAEALATGRVDDAYAWSREALRSDPGFAGAWNTLGVVYLRHGNVAEAAPVFEHVLSGDAGNTPALSNLVQTYSRLGRSEEAAAVRQRLVALEPFAPFHFFHLGLQAMQRNDFAAARGLFAREVSRADYHHEFHYWLGVADWRLGDLAAAQRQLTLALDNSTTRHQTELYAAKLAWLKSRRKP